MDDCDSFLVWGARESRRDRTDDMGRGRHLETDCVGRVP
jgi:hypothetical protein